MRKAVIATAMLLFSALLTLLTACSHVEPVANEYTDNPALLLSKWDDFGKYWQRNTGAKAAWQAENYYEILETGEVVWYKLREGYRPNFSSLPTFPDVTQDGTLCVGVDASSGEPSYFRLSGDRFYPVTPDAVLDADAPYVLEYVCPPVPDDHYKQPWAVEANDGDTSKAGDAVLLEDMGGRDEVLRMRLVDDPDYWYKKLGSSGLVFTSLIAAIDDIDVVKQIMDRSDSAALKFHLYWLYGSPTGNGMLDESYKPESFDEDIRPFGEGLTDSGFLDKVEEEAS